MNRARRLRQGGTTVALAAAAVLAAGCETEGVSGCMEVPRTALDRLDVSLKVEGVGIGRAAIGARKVELAHGASSNDAIA